MRWDALFNDLESQIAESDRLSLEAEITERARVEMVDGGYADRLRGAIGSRIKIQLHYGETVEGALCHAGADALVLNDGPQQVLIPYTGVARYEGLGRFLGVEPSKVGRGIGLARSLRALARDRAPLVLAVGSRTGTIRLEGVIDRVGKDYIDFASVAPGEARRSQHVQQVSTIPFAALSAIRSLRAGDL